MHLEANGGSNGVSESLERVQGHERLVVEKYRAMARLAAKRKRQPVAPPAQPAPGQIQLVTAQAPVGRAPLFRLASEVPVRNPKLSDPFERNMENILADDAPEKPILMPSASLSEANEPVGTGVADANDPFADIDVLGTPEGKAKPTSVMGAVFRALTRTTVPNVQGVLPTGVAPGIPTGRDAAAFEEAATGDESPFDESPFDAEPFGDATDGDDDDPFADF